MNHTNTNTMHVKKHVRSCTGLVSTIIIPNLHVTYIRDHDFTFLSPTTRNNSFSVGYIEISIITIISRSIIIQIHRRSSLPEGLPFFFKYEYKKSDPKNMTFLLFALAVCLFKKFLDFCIISFQRLPGILQIEITLFSLKTLRT